MACNVGQMAEGVWDMNSGAGVITYYIPFESRSGGGSNGAYRFLIGAPGDRTFQDALEEHMEWPSFTHHSNRISSAVRTVHVALRGSRPPAMRGGAVGPALADCHVLYTHRVEMTSRVAICLSFDDARLWRRATHTTVMELLPSKWGMATSYTRSSYIMYPYLSPICAHLRQAPRHLQQSPTLTRRRCLLSPCSTHRIETRNKITRTIKSLPNVANGETRT